MQLGQKVRMCELYVNGGTEIMHNKVGYIRGTDRSGNVSVKFKTPFVINKNSRAEDRPDGYTFTAREASRYLRGMRE
ncbi:hypothetical protein OAU50_02790 [Planctomycetota bacterium]|nr:hypothetical protein [Planctomycetota bacterium]